MKRYNINQYAKLGDLVFYIPDTLVIDGNQFLIEFSAISTLNGIQDRSSSYLHIQYKNIRKKDIEHN